MIPSSRTAYRPRSSGGARRPVRRKAAMTSPQRSRRLDVPGPPSFSSRDVYASELRGQPSIPDFGSARCRPHAQRGWRPNWATEIHLHVQPRGDPEQHDALSLSDTARRGMHGPRDDRVLGATHDVPDRRRGLHVVVELSRQRQSGVRIHHERRRHHNTSGLVGQFTLPPGTPQLMVDEVGPGDDESRCAGRFRHQRAKHGGLQRVQRDAARSAAERPDWRDVRHRAAGVERARFCGGRHDAVPGKGPLVQGTDYSLAYDGAACELTFRTLTAASVVGVGERLIIAYRTQLDADTQNGITLTNVVGATEWFNDFGSNPGRSVYTRTLTNGTSAPSTTRTRTPSTSCRGCTPRRRRRCNSTACRPASSTRATCCATRSGFTTTAAAVHAGHVARHGAPNTTYVADSMTLNGQPVRRPDGGISPLIAGVDVSSSNLTPPLPASGAGILSAGQMAVIQFDLRVNDGAPPGTVIRNQATSPPRSCRGCSRMATAIPRRVPSRPSSSSPARS